MNLGVRKQRRSRLLLPRWHNALPGTMPQDAFLLSPPLIQQRLDLQETPDHPGAISAEPKQSRASLSPEDAQCAAHVVGEERFAQTDHCRWVSWAVIPDSRSEPMTARQVVRDMHHFVIPSG
jgi:hypothetical protein